MQTFLKHPPDVTLYCKNTIAIYLEAHRQKCLWGIEGKRSREGGGRSNA
jgi:hypothetical protein